MILDVAVIGIFTISTIAGKRHGFLETILRLGMLVLSLVCGVMFTESVADWLCVMDMDSILRERLSEYAMNGQINPASLIPGEIGETLTEITDSTLTTSVRSLANIIVTTTAFMIIVIIVSIFARWLRKKLHKSKLEKGVIGTVDDGVGLMIGALKGAILVCLFLAFLLPITGIFVPDRINEVSELLNKSYIAGYVYDINPLLGFMRKLNL